MTAPTIEQLPVRVPGSSLPSSLHHLTCCRDDDPGEVALCGTDVSGEPWKIRGTKATCLVCADLEFIACDPDGPACPVIRRPS